ncbi:uncharacterized protein CYBJADRAFT_169439 [Cyberlindnera jadinii NRRL Y-1542]|uniref:Uncharacterized protein n=1 Tax=Cyberlindnera jadinii (strain ATCC 18201 / CBS 1600 / BCRC 20928 / JCM 3617 / NBRC 0987 / NRRL Y-1542) TaxID=983966 RepID=A0A1E4RVT7_CYBJN|nr:hypothetical protein CYBJADRAFT_169439 [Cyberlindnera jadinii NRRL Y-1542]ODV71392.1 hypothetical protein CYBJADRAFT_169439 [Cyberlindnera jadinii NRRL Y-1542]
MYESLHRALSGTSFSKFTDRTQTGKYTIQMLLTALFTSDTNHNQRNNQATDDGVQEGLNHFEIALLLQDNRYIDNILSKEDAIELSRMISDWGGDEPGDEPQQEVEGAPALTKDAVGPAVSDSTVEWEKAQDEFLQQLEGAISDQSDDSPAADSGAFSNDKRTTHAGKKVVGSSCKLLRAVFPSIRFIILFTR